MEYGLQLTELAIDDPRVCILGVVKEGGNEVNDEAITNFYQRCFHFPLLKDEHWTLFNSLGDVKVNPWSMFKNVVGLLRRTKKKGLTGIPNTRQGDFWTKGGTMIFDQSGELVYTQKEPEYGKLYNMELVRMAVSRARLPDSNSVPTKKEP